MKVWQDQITEARCWEDLLDVARAYLASLSPDEWNALPHACRPERIKGVDDLAYWHECLADEFVRVAKGPSNDEGLRRTLVFFTAAAERAAEICGRALSPADDAANDRRHGERRSQGRAD
jgi:hypothetical protein